MPTNIRTTHYTMVLILQHITPGHCTWYKTNFQTATSNLYITFGANRPLKTTSGTEACMQWVAVSSQSTIQSAVAAIVTDAPLAIHTYIHTYIHTCVCEV